jgi:hypothetical protein
MKYTATITFFMLAILIPSIIMIAGISFFNSLPPVVKFTLPVPLKYNCTEFDVEVSFSWLSVMPETTGYRSPWEHYKVSEYPTPTITGTARVDSEITLTMRYYGNETVPTSIGLNTVTKTEAIYLGTEIYDIVVQETNDNVVGQFDNGLTVLIAVSTVVCLVSCSAGIQDYRIEKRGKA